jgi:hypothetical protein
MKWNAYAPGSSTRANPCASSRRDSIDQLKVCDPHSSSPRITARWRVRRVVAFFRNFNWLSVFFKAPVHFEPESTFEEKTL